MKHYRLMGILLLLENNHVMTASQLAEHFEVSVRTIYRDIDVLSEAGYGIITESGKGGGISLMYSKRLRLSAMDERELFRVAQKFAVKDSDDLLSQNIALKIRSQLPVEAQHIFDKLTKVTLIDHSNWQGKVQNTDETLAVIHESIIKTLKVTIDYTSGSGFSVDRILWPLGIVRKSSQAYLVAFCEKRNEIRTFKVDKISKIKLMKEIFTLEDEFDLRKYWKLSVGNYTQGNEKPNISRVVSDGGPHYPVKLKCAEANLIYLSGFKLLEISEDGSYVFDLISNDIALSQIFGKGESIIVISPPELREKIVEKSRNIIANYTNEVAF
ncbi:helix-turn-helix transcriptional regulator [Fusibacter bizertensis]